MATSTSRTLLRCANCGRVYPVSELRDEASYACMRCDAVISGSGSERIYLYGGRPEGETDRPLPRPSGGVVAAEQTWGAGPEDTLPDTAELGTVGRYDLLEELGRGGMGVVYRAWDADLDRGVAIKLLLAGGRAGQAQVERFLREARAGAQLDHPNLVRVHDIGRHEGQVYFTMDLVDGPSLADVLDEVERLPPHEAARIVAAVARGVHHAHVAGLLHRDLKPGNVLLEATGRPLVTDFGLVKSLTGDDATLTRTGQVLGTPAYMAPEQALGGEASRASDVYSLGGVLYRALSGQAPYEGDGVASVIVRVAREGPPSLETLGVEAPPDLALICGVAMAREPERRYPTALALAEDLERFLRGDPVLAQRPSLAYRIRSSLRRHRAATAAVSAALVTALLVVAGLATQRGLASWREHQRAQEAAEALAVVLKDGDRAALERFAERPELQGTPAIADAWIAAAEHARDAGEDEEELAAWARAWRTATSDRQVYRVGLGLARALKARWRFEDLDRALSTLVERLPSAARDETVRQLHLEAALGRGAMATALERAEGGPHEALVRSLAPVLATGISGAVKAVADLDGDGEDELVLQREGQLERRALRPDLPLLARSSAPEHTWLLPVRWPGGDLLVTSGFRGAWQQDREILRWTGDQAQVVHRWRDGAPMAAASADLDRDGVQELYVGIGMGGRRLLRFDETDRGWAASEPHPQTNQLNSDITGLLAADLAPGGAPELVVAASAWGAWDLRVLAAADEGLERIARHRIGETTILPFGVVDGPGGPRLAVAKARRFPSRGFPATDRRGAPSGVYLFRWSGGELVLDGAVPLPTPPGVSGLDPRRMRIADLDGDGLDDIVLQRQVANRDVPGAILHQTAEGTFVPLDLPSISGHPVELDGDPAAEILLVRDGEIVVAGMGQVASEPERATLRLRPPVGLPEAFAAPWSRATELLSMGLLAEAAAAFEDVAQLCRAPVAGAAWAQAAATYGEAERLDDAARAWTAAAEHGAEQGEALTEALRARVRDHRFDDAALLAERLVALDPDSEDARSALARAAAPRLSLDFGSALDERWRVSAPLQLVRDRRGSLIAELAQPVTEPLLERTLRLEGDRVGLTVEVEVERAEWGSGFTLELRSGERALGVGLYSVGGGGFVEHRIGCHVPSSPDNFEQAVRPATAADDRMALVLAVDWIPATGRARCSTTLDGVEIDRSSAPSTGELDEHVTLALRAHGETPVGAGARIRLRRIDVVGAIETDPPALTDFERGALDWVNGARGAALERWREAGLDAGGEVALAVALQRAAEGDEAARRLRPSLDDPHLLGALRQDPRPVLELLERIEAGLGGEKLEEAYRIALAMHGDEAWLAGVLEPVAGLNPPRTLAHESLLLTRGRATLAAGAVEAGLSDLEQVTREAEDPRVRLVASMTLAGHLARAGDLEAALQHARRAISLAPAPEPIRDELRQQPELRALLDRPEWRELLVDGPELWIDGTEHRWE